MLPTRQAKAEKEERRNREVRAENPRARINSHHRNFLDKWWLLSYPRAELVGKIDQIPRYIACGRVTKRPIFEFMDNQVRLSDALQVFPLPDDYSFGILQAGIHWLWFVERCSTLKGDFRYTSDTVFDAYPWPQSLTPAQIEVVAESAISLRALRRGVMYDNGWSLRELYRTLELPGANSLKAAHDALDTAVRDAYGMAPKEDPLTFLLVLNGELATREEDGQRIVGPGLPPTVEDARPSITPDRISSEGWQEY